MRQQPDRMFEGPHHDDMRGVPVPGGVFRADTSEEMNRADATARLGRSPVHITWTAVFRSEARFAAFVTTAYVLLVAPILYHHSMWRDELQAWLLARDSRTLPELFGNLKYDGHSGLWHLCLMPLTRLSDSPAAMQTLHLVIAAATCFIIAMFAPFSRTVRTLIPFGYFFFYEYSIVSRNYALGVLLAVIVCALYPRRRSRLPWIAILLFLLAHTSAHGVILVVAIALPLAWECQRRGLEFDSPTRKIWVGSFLLIGLGVVTSIIQMNPPPDSGFAMGWYHTLNVQRIRDVSGALGEAFLPVPRPQLHFWGTNLLSAVHPWATPMLSLIAFTWSLLLLRKAPLALFTYLVGTLGLSFFAYAKYYAGPRHGGFFFVLFLACLWISHEGNGRPRMPRTSTIGSGMGGWAHSTLLVLLVVHIAAAAVAAVQEVRFPFSHSRSVATFLKRTGLDEALIVGDPDYAASAIAGYTWAKIFCVPANRAGTFIVWDKARLRPVSPADVLRKAEELSVAGRDQDVILLTNYRIELSATEQHGIALLATFLDSIAREDFFIYKVVRRHPIPAAAEGSASARQLTASSLPA